MGVTIVYPISGGSYPITDPGPGSLRSAYLTASFSVSCDGGQHNVEWGFDGDPHGSAAFYDQISVQFVSKHEGGGHVFWVRSDCGEDKVEFQVGS